MKRGMFWRSGLLWSGVAASAFVAAVLAFKPGPAVADGPVGGVPPAPPPTALPSVIVFQPVSDLPEWDPSDDEVLATTEAEFQSLLQQYANLPGFRGTIIITDDPDTTETWPPVDTGVTHLRIRFRDVAYYNDVWVPQLDDDWVPGFLEQLQADPTPPASEALYDLDIWQVVDAEDAKIVTARVQAADGAIGFVSQAVVPHNYKQTGDRYCPGAGPMYDMCCGWQLTNCRVGAWVIGCWFHDDRWACYSTCLLMDCYDCYDDCVNCQPSNPCHSCDPCGMSWFWCQWFGHC